MIFAYETVNDINILAGMNLQQLQSCKHHSWRHIREFLSHLVSSIAKSIAYLPKF